MKITQTIFIAIFFFVSCKKELSQQEKFATFLNSIPELPIPFLANSITDLESKMYIDTIYKEFNNENAHRIYGKTKINDSIFGVVYLMAGDNVFPMLVTYNTIGEKIAMLDMVHIPGGSDGYYANGASYLVMNRQFDIEITDTIHSFERDSLTEIIETTRKIEVIIEKYKIASDGKINRKDL